MKKILVQLPHLTYPIAVGAPLRRIGAGLKPKAKGTRVLVVSDSHVAPRHGSGLTAGLKAAGWRPVLAVVKAGEASKNIKTVQSLYKKCLAAGLDRQGLIVALGGGVVGDMAGFVAASFMRGLPFVQCPTSLLAMVDSSIGGKVGVDLPEGKNLVGAFWQPRLVHMDLSVLKTLPDREWRTGMAEVIKYGFMADKSLLPVFEREDLTSLRRQPQLIEKLVARSAQIKARVVSGDERDVKGEREKLNLGHTFGHAIESVTKYKGYTHGEAIAIGFCAAVRLAARLKKGPLSDVERVDRIVARWKLPTRVRRSLPRRKILAAMSRDKKTVGGKFRFVIPTGLGRAATVKGVPQIVLNKVLQEVGL